MVCGINGTLEEPTLDEIKDCDETIEVNRLALKRLYLIADDTYPQNAYDREAIYTVRDALEE